MPTRHPEISAAWESHREALMESLKLSLESGKHFTMVNRTPIDNRKPHSIKDRMVIAESSIALYTARALMAQSYVRREEATLIFFAAVRRVYGNDMLITIGPWDFVHQSHGYILGNGEHYTFEGSRNG